MSISPISPRLTKGAFIEFSKRFGTAWLPNIIVFQYNPESISRKLEGWKEETEKDKSPGGTAQPFDPGETLDFKLELDAGDLLNNPAVHHVAAASGVADRIAAIEMLMYPVSETSVGGLLISVGSTLGGAAVSSAGTGFGTGTAGALLGGVVSQFGPGMSNAAVTSLKVPRGTVPTVLFAWSSARIVPVRITSFSVEEQSFAPNLFVHRATISIGLKILAPKDIPCSKNEPDKKAITAYNIYQQQKRDLAALNIDSVLADTTEETIGRFTR